MQDPTTINSVKRIVVAIDLSMEHAKRCISMAATLLESSAAEREIIVISVIKNSDIVDTEGRVDHRKLELAEQAFRGLHDALVVKSGAFTFQKKIRSELLRADDVADAICDFCKANDADMVIVGRRGMGFLKGLILGSISEKVVKNAPCSVLVVK
ncbi:MAG: universal stress protein [Thermoproteota archaeon]